MVQSTQPTSDICRLDYLVGTLATAYKGVIKSLVVKDFCISESGGVTILKGTVLSMPVGNYEASLNKSGVALSRVGLENGYFEFSVESGRIAGARDLQIDIIQSGRHIGTFLLKKETSNGLFISAVELSQEIADFDLTRLTAPLRGKVGLLQNAEDIVSQIHSTKKDWAAFSNMLHGFAIDFFWSAPEGFYRAFDILAHFAVLAAERAGTIETHKPVSDYLDLLELPLQNEQDQTRLRTLAATWVLELARSSIDLSSETGRACALLRELIGKFPEIDTSRVLSQLIGSLREKSAAAPFVSGRLLAGLDAFLPHEDRELLTRFGEQGQNRMAQKLIEARQELDKANFQNVLDLLSRIDLDLLHDEKWVSAFFDVAERDLTTEAAGPFAAGLAAYLSSSRKLSGRALDMMRMKLPRIFDRLLAEGGADACTALLRSMKDAGHYLYDRIMLDPDIARAILGSGPPSLKAQYLHDLQELMVPSARVKGISPDTWAEIVNPLHLTRLNEFMDLLMIGGGQLTDVLVHVTANLAVGEALIPDDRLFQRRISAYVNSRAMRERFVLNYLLLTRLPVYFNDVGATSRLRDYSTELDSWGNDPIIYFVRKQVHVNASSHNVRLLESVLRSWAGNDPSVLKEVVPPDIYAQANPDLFSRYASVIGPFFSALGAEDPEGFHPDRLQAVPDEVIDTQLRKEDGADGEAREKVRLLCKLYKEVVKKYSLVARDSAWGNAHDRLLSTLRSLRERKSVLLSRERTEPQESLYFKRHIAFGIPSVLGTYHEAKFDALKDMIGFGEAIPVLLESIISEVEQKGASAEDNEVKQWLDALFGAAEILKTFGMENLLVDEYHEVLVSNRFQWPQVIDVLKMWQKELAWMVFSLTRTFLEPLKEVIRKFPFEDLPDHLRSLEAGSSDFINKAADIVMRDILGSIPALVECDRLLEALIKALRLRRASEPEGLRDTSRQTLDRDYYDLHAISLEDARKIAPDLGSKAKNLVYLRDRGLDLAAGVVLSARYTKNYEMHTSGPGFRETLKEAVKLIEKRTGREYGGTGRPLFLSVRSGSYPSMPGILSSLLYCGMNDETLDAFIRTTDNPVLGWDSYRKFIEYYSTSVFGVDGNFFEQAAKDYRSALPQNDKEAQDPLHPRSIVRRYLSGLKSKGLLIPSDVYEQLHQCIRSVYASWCSDRAKQFRSATRTSEEWGTSVTLMEMVSGNQAGAGATVFFTRDPHTFEQGIFGETLENASGDDLASGTKSGLLLSRAQAGAGQRCLEETNPDLYQLHLKTAGLIEDAFNGLPQEVEATYTRDKSGQYRLFVLQTRRMEQGKRYFEKFDEICRMESRVIGQGIGAAGGALSGVASFAASPDRIELLKAKTGLPVILVRRTANTDDVSLMPVISGIVTASGGVTSHAAVLAQKFGISAVVSCSDMTLGNDDRGRPSARIGNTQIAEGDPLSIDGTTGLVFSGLCFQMNST